MPCSAQDVRSNHFCWRSWDTFWGFRHNVSVLPGLSFKIDRSIDDFSDVRDEEAAFWNLIHEGFKQKSAEFWYAPDVILSDLIDSDNEKSQRKASQTTRKQKFCWIVYSRCIDENPTIQFYPDHRPPQASNRKDMNNRERKLMYVAASFRKNSRAQQLHVVFWGRARSLFISCGRWKLASI